MNNFFSSMDISASGLTAERMRMEVTANNLANANTTKGADGQPYRRQTVVFESVREALLDGSSAHGLQGVRIAGIESDQSEFPTIQAEGHPHADGDGILKLPNVQVPREMIDLITASRSYEANLKAMSSFKEMIEQSLTLLRGGQ